MHRLPPLRKTVRGYDTTPPPLRVPRARLRQDADRVGRKFAMRCGREIIHRPEVSKDVVCCDEPVLLADLAVPVEYHSAADLTDGLGAPVPKVNVDGPP